MAVGTAHRTARLVLAPELVRIERLELAQPVPAQPGRLAYAPSAASVARTPPAVVDDESRAGPCVAARGDANVRRVDGRHGVVGKGCMAAVEASWQVGYMLARVRVRGPCL